MRIEVSSDGPVCPKCGYTFTPDEDYYFDGFRYREDECPECGITFTVEIEHEVVWTTSLKDEEDGSKNHDHQAS